jgi:hypothetical protein
MTRPVLISTTLAQKALLVAEKTIWAFGYQFAVVLATVGTVNLWHKQSWVQAADSAGWAALLALGTSLITVLSGLVVTGYLDVVLRVVLQFLQSFFGVLIASATASFINAPWQGALGTAVLAAMAALAKCLLALKLPTLGASVVGKDRPSTTH